MVEGADLSADLSETAWLDAIRQLGDARGSFSELGQHHAALFIEQSNDVLFVGFETIHGMRTGSESGAPLAFDVCETRGWSHLTLISKAQHWYRDPAVFAYMDGLIDADFFDQFDRIIFYGAGMCGYAAAAFSVAAPGATVILISPQSTLDPDIAGWDDRFPTARRIDFSGRFADAPRLLDAAEQALMIYDPGEREDAMHASLFRGTNIDKLRYRRGSAGAIEGDLRAMSLVSRLCQAAAADRLTLAAAAKLVRARKRHVPYLRALLSRVLREERPALTRQLCRAVLADQPLPRFKQQLERAEAQLERRRTKSNKPKVSRPKGQSPSPKAKPV